MLQVKKWSAFKSNLHSGIDYYKELFAQSNFFTNEKEQIQQQLEMYRLQVNEVKL